jgi:hypothetical protein
MYLSLGQVALAAHLVPPCCRCVLVMSVVIIEPSSRRSTGYGYHRGGAALVPVEF